MYCFWGAVQKRLFLGSTIGGISYPNSGKEIHEFLETPHGSYKYLAGYTTKLIRIAEGFEFYNLAKSRDVEHPYVAAGINVFGNATFSHYCGAIGGLAVAGISDTLWVGALVGSATLAPYLTPTIASFGLPIHIASYGLGLLGGELLCGEIYSNYLASKVEYIIDNSILPNRKTHTNLPIFSEDTSRNGLFFRDPLNDVKKWEDFLDNRPYPTWRSARIPIL